MDEASTSGSLVGQLQDYANSGYWSEKKKSFAEWERKLEIREGVVAEKEVQVAEKLKTVLNPYDDAIMKLYDEDRELLAKRRQRLFEMYDESWLKIVQSRIFAAKQNSSPAKSWTSGALVPEETVKDGEGEEISFHADEDEMMALEDDAAAPATSSGAAEEKQRTDVGEATREKTAAENGDLKGRNAELGEEVMSDGGGKTTDCLLTDLEVAEEEDKSKVAALLVMLRQAQKDAKCKVELAEIVEPYLKNLVEGMRSGVGFFTVWEYVDELKEKMKICSSCLHQESEKRKKHLDPFCKQDCCNPRRCCMCLHPFSGKACSCNCPHARRFLKLLKEWAKNQS